MNVHSRFNCNSPKLEATQMSTDGWIDKQIMIEPYNSIDSEVAQPCPTLCDPVDSSQPGSPVHVIFQARILEWIAISFSRGSSWSRDRTQVSCIVGRRFTVWATREVYNSMLLRIKKLWFFFMHK